MEISSPSFVCKGCYTESLWQPFLDNFQTKRTKKNKQIGQEKVALTITGAGVVARKLTSQTTSASCWTSPRQRLDGFFITSLSQVMHMPRLVAYSALVIVSRSAETRSKMFRQHLKCSLTAPRRAGTSSGFFCFFLLRQLSEPGRLGTA